MDKTNIDLNAPAFGPGAQTLDGLNTSVEEQAPEVTEEEETVEPVEETKVPYSRFKNVNEARRQAEAEAEEWRRKAEELESQYHAPRYEESSDDMPAYWVELYGDSEASKKAWAIQQRREQEIEQRAYEAGQRGAQELEQRQQERLSSNVAVIDENFEELSDFIGRDLTAKEQSALLDIVDEYTAKDEYGNYQGALMPFDKAWEIYELKQATAKSSTRQARDGVAALAATRTEGNTVSTDEQNKNWNPFERGSWKKRLNS